MASSRQSALSSGGCANGRPMKWKKEMREFLCVLHEEWPGKANKQKRLSIFQDKYGAYATACGVDAITDNMLSAQYGERNKPRKSRDWEEICSTSLTPSEAEQRDKRRDAMRNDIRRLASSCSVPVAEPATKRPRLAPNRASSGSIETFDSDVLERSPSPETPRKSPRRTRVLSAYRFARAGDETLDWTPPTPQSIRDNTQPFQTPSPIAKSARKRKASHEFGGPLVVKKYLYTRPGDDPRRIARLTTPATKTQSGRAKDGRPAHALLALTLEQTVEANKKWEPPTAQEAHAWPGALLYRFFRRVPEHLHNYGPGFLSRYHAEYPDIWPGAPTYDMLSPHDLALHVQKLHFPSQYISLSNNFFWVVRQAFKKHEKLGGEAAAEMCISVIATDRLDQSGLYHLFPYHRKLKMKFPYYDAAEKYGTSHEWLAWAKIPPGAIIRTIGVTHLLKQTFASARAKSLLSYDLLAKTSIEAAALKFRNEPHNRKLKHAIPFLAQLSNYMGITAGSTSEQISALLTDMVRGWCFSYGEDEDWGVMESRFADELLRCCKRTLIGKAFRSGVYWASGAQTVPNPWHSVKAAASLKRRAERFGLVAPKEDRRMEGSGRFVSEVVDLQIRVEGVERETDLLQQTAGHLQSDESDDDLVGGDPLLSWRK